MKKRDELIAGIEKIIAEKDDFENRKKQVLENEGEWTEGEFTTIIPNEPPLEVDNDIE